MSGPTVPAPDAATLAGLREPVSALARAAGAAIMSVYRAGLAADEKPDGTPVTAADHAAEAAILRGLAALTPDIPVVSEEAVAAGRAPDVAGGLFWLVDPLDGTREFLKRNDEFSVNIGLVHGDDPLLGVLYGPAVDTLYVAAGAGTAIRIVGAGAREPIACRAPVGDARDILVSRSHNPAGRTEKWLAGRGIAVAGRVRQGSALKFGRLAAGEADLYPRLGPTSEWDTAAGHAILVAAGGALTTLDGGRLRYGKVADGWRNPGFLATGRRPASG